MGNYPYITKLFADKLTEDHKRLRHQYCIGLLTYAEYIAEFLKVCEEVNNVLELMEG